MQEMWVRFLGWENPLEEETATHSSLFAWEIHGQRTAYERVPIHGGGSLQPHLMVEELP